MLSLKPGLFVRNPCKKSTICYPVIAVLSHVSLGRTMKAVVIFHLISKLNNQAISSLTDEKQMAESAEMFDNKTIRFET